MNREEMLRLADAEMQRAQEALEAQHTYEMEILKAIRQIYTPKRERETMITAEVLWEIVRAVADADCTYYDDLDTYCIFQCGGEEFVDGHLYHHTETCPVTKARALVEQAKRGEEHA